MLTRNMKDSGVEWIGDIPEDWEIIKTKRKFKTNKTIVGDKYTNFDRLSLTLNGVLKRPFDDNKGLQPQNLKTYQILNESDLIFKLIDLENVKTSRVGYSNYQGLVSPVYIRLINPTETRFGYYYYMNMWYQEIFNALGAGVRSSLSATDLLNIPYIFISSVKEKHNIVEFLDKKINQINSIISDTQQSIIELKKYKQSLITETVTKGLDKTVEMKDSGIEWIGEVPENWFVTKLNNLFTIKKEIANELGYDILSVTQHGLKIKDIENNSGQMSADYSKYQIVEPENFVMNHMDLLTGWIDISQFVGVTSPDYRVFKCKEKTTTLNKYYLYIFQICYSNRIFYGLGQGVSNVGRWRLQTDKFLNFYLPLPSIKEQQQIVEFLDNKTSKIDSLIADKEKMIIEYEAYKKSLIYEYVTGKKQV